MTAASLCGLISVGIVSSDVVEDIFPYSNLLQVMFLFCLNQGLGKQHHGLCWSFGQEFFQERLDLSPTGREALKYKCYVPFRYFIPALFFNTFHWNITVVYVLWIQDLN